MITEMWIDRIARTVCKSPEEVRMLNMYKNNDKTFYGQVLDGCQLQAFWDNVSLLTIQILREGVLFNFASAVVRAYLHAILPLRRSLSHMHLHLRM